MRALEQLRELLHSSTTAIVIRGITGVGKTTLVEQFRAGPEAVRSIAFTVRDYVDAEKMETESIVQRQIASAIAQELRLAGILPAHIRAEDVFEGNLIREVLPEICRLELPRLIVAIDELDLLAPSAIRRVWRDFFRVSHLERPPLFVGVIGQTWGEQPAAPSSDDSRAFTIRLSPWSREELEQVLGAQTVDPRRPLLSPADAWTLTRGIPLLWHEVERLAAVHQVAAATPDASSLIASLTAGVAGASSALEAAAASATEAARLAMAILAASSPLPRAEVRTRMESEWALVPAEPDQCLENLVNAGLLVEDADGLSLPAFLAAILPRLSQRVDRPAGGGDASAAVRHAQALERSGNKDGAIDHLRAVVGQPSGTVDIQIALARLLFSRAQASSGRAGDLAEAETLLIDCLTHARLASSRVARQLLCRVLIQRALDMEPSNYEYPAICARVAALDPELSELGAERLIARLEVAEWSRHVDAVPLERIGGITRDVLRHDRCWDLVAQRLVEWLEDNLENRRQIARAQWLLTGVAQPLLEAPPRDVAHAAFWPLVIRTLELLSAGESGAPVLRGATWRVLASALPAIRRDQFVSVALPLLTRDLGGALLSLNAADARDIVGAITLLHSAAVIQAVLVTLEQVTVAAYEDATSRQVLAQSLGPCLHTLLRVPDLPAGADAVLSGVATFFFDATSSDTLYVSEESHVAWFQVVTARHDLRTGGGGAFLSRLHRTEASSAIDNLTIEEKVDIERLLNDAYDVKDRVRLTIPGLTTGITDETVRGYRLSGKGDAQEDYLLRVYSLRGPDQGMTRVLRSLWDKERRTLATLSVVQAGRALMRYVDARFDVPTDRALLVTEWPGTETLADRLRTGRTGMLAPALRLRLWGHLAVLLESLQTLHRSGFIHRAITPSVVFVTNTADALDGRVAPGLRLGHFEWSVYLRGLSSMAPPLSRKLTRYAAPEALRATLEVEHRVKGESFGSDLYSIGLLLFECLVRPLREEELGAYKTANDYDEMAQEKHRAWLDTDLRGEVDRATGDRQAGALLVQRERDILLSLLHFDLWQRPTSLDGIVRVAASLATAHTEVSGPLRLVTTLTRRNKIRVDAASRAYDPRTDPRNIASRLTTVVPQVALAKNPETELNADGLAAIVQKELRKAAVHLNASPDDFPLVLVSRSGVRFRVRPLEWADRDTDDGAPKPSDPRIGFLEVARRDDRPLEPPVAHLTQDLTIIDVTQIAVNEARWSVRPGTASWEPLFRIAAGSRPDVRAYADAEHRRRVLASSLSLATAFEYEAVSEDIGFDVIGEGERDGQAYSVLRAVAGGTNLAERFAHVSDEDPDFELASRRTPIGKGRRVSLPRSAFDLESGTVTVPIAKGDLPANGVIRPASSIGAEVLHARRRRIFRQVEDDDFLLDSLVAPGTGRFRSGGADLGRPFIEDLDNDKRRIADRFFSLDRLLVVQGPPATGKTTLAAEIVFRMLDRVPNARILVTTHGHEPLDNLLERVIEEGDQNDRAKKTLHEIELVRMVSGRRKKDSPKARLYYPHTRAEALFRQIQSWSKSQSQSLGLVGDVARIVSRELAGYVSAPYSLQRRVQESANLVFATINSQHIELGGSASYDLVIVEEAARCFPIEIAGAMRLSRRWLLIGDHMQLPPFAFRDVLQAFDTWTTKENARLVGESDRKAASRLDDIRRSFADYLSMFQHLHEASGPHADTLHTQWRMHPVLGSLVSRAFYRGEAVTNPKQADDLARLTKRRIHHYSAPHYLKGKQLLWIHTDRAQEDNNCAEQNEKGGLLSNEIERRTIVALLRQMRQPKVTKDISILTPYRAQAELLIGLLQPDVNDFQAFGVLDDRVFTVDAFQGRQAGTVVLSLVRNNRGHSAREALGFLADPKRATVMFSRAEKLLIVVGCLNHFRAFASSVEWVAHVEGAAELLHYSDVLPQVERRKVSQL